VLKDGEKLLRNLEDVFRCSWARPPVLGVSAAPRQSRTSFKEVQGTEKSVEFTLWLFNIAMENCPFTDDFPMKTSIYNGFSIAKITRW